MKENVYTLKPHMKHTVKGTEILFDQKQNSTL